MFTCAAGLAGATFKLSRRVSLVPTRRGLTALVCTAASREFGLAGALDAVRRGFAVSPRPSAGGFAELPRGCSFAVVLLAVRRGFAASSLADTLPGFVFFIVLMARIVAQVWEVGAKVVISATVFLWFQG